MACLVCWGGVSRWCRVVRSLGLGYLVVLDSDAGVRLPGVYRVVSERQNVAQVRRG